MPGHEEQHPGEHAPAAVEEPPHQRLIPAKRGHVRARNCTRSLVSTHKPAMAEPVSHIHIGTPLQRANLAVTKRSINGE